MAAAANERASEPTRASERVATVSDVKPSRADAKAFDV